jgi:hypothetical protein
MNKYLTPFTYPHDLGDDDAMEGVHDGSTPTTSKSMEQLEMHQILDATSEGEERS